MPHHKPESVHSGRRPSVFDRLGSKSAASRPSTIARRSRSSKNNKDRYRRDLADNERAARASVRPDGQYRPAGRSIPSGRRRDQRCSSTSSDDSSSSSGSSSSDSDSSLSSESAVSGRSSSDDSRLEDRKRRRKFHSKEYSKPPSRRHRASFGSELGSSGLLSKRQSDSDSRGMSAVRRSELHKSQLMMGEDFTSRDRRRAVSSQRKTMKPFLHSLSERSFQRSRSRERRCSPCSAPRRSPSPSTSRRNSDIRTHRGSSSLLAPSSFNSADTSYAGKRRYGNSRDSHRHLTPDVTSHRRYPTPEVTSHRRSRRSDGRSRVGTGSSQSSRRLSPADSGDASGSRVALDSDDTEQPDPSDMIIRDEVRCDDAVSDADSIVSLDNQPTEERGPTRETSPARSRSSGQCDSDGRMDSGKTSEDKLADITAVGAAPTGSPHSDHSEKADGTSKVSVAGTSDDLALLKIDPVKCSNTPELKTTLLPADSFSDFSDDADEILNREDDECVKAEDESAEPSDPMSVDSKNDPLVSAVSCSHSDSDLKQTSDSVGIWSTTSDTPSAKKEAEDWHSVDWIGLMADSPSALVQVQNSSGEVNVPDEAGTEKDGEVAAVDSETVAGNSETVSGDDKAASVARKASNGRSVLFRSSPTSLLKCLGVCRDWISSDGLARLRQLCPHDDNWPPDVSTAPIVGGDSPVSGLLMTADPAFSILQRASGRVFSI